MDIYFADKKLEKISADERTMDRKLGTDRAKRLRRRIAQLDAAETLDDVCATSQARGATNWPETGRDNCRSI